MNEKCFRKRILTIAGQFEIYVGAEANSVSFIEVGKYLYCDLRIFGMFQHLMSGWFWDYSYKCQPVDYSSEKKAMRVNIFFIRVSPVVSIFIGTSSDIIRNNRYYLKVVFVQKQDVKHYSDY